MRSPTTPTQIEMPPIKNLTNRDGFIVSSFEEVVYVLGLSEYQKITDGMPLRHTRTVNHLEASLV